MNVDNGHLVRDINDVAKERQGDYARVPKHLMQAALSQLAGTRETTVNVDRPANWSEKKLARWAEEKREKRLRTRRRHGK